MKSDLFDDWTRDADGNYVDWRKPPYYVNGVLNVMMEHEEFISSPDISKRITEYMQLTRRAMSRRKENAPRAQTQRGVGKTQRRLQDSH